jgi:hypothetical protein
MAWNYYFKDRSGGQNGPVSFEELVAVARAGRLAPDCLVWPEGGEPRSARDVPELVAAMSAPATPATVFAAGAGPMRADFPVWDLFWRSIVAGLGLIFIIPAPWAALWLYRWLMNRVSLPNGARLALESDLARPAALFIGLALTILIPSLYGAGDPNAGKRVDVSIVQLIGSLAQVGFSFLILRWLVGASRSEDGALRIGFYGGFWGFFGWNLLLGLSIFTIVGWAWVLRLQMRWICANIAGSHRFEFVGEGLELLWRTLVVVFGCLLILPIPWLIAWYYNWFLTQFTAAPALENPALSGSQAA